MRQAIREARAVLVFAGAVLAVGGWVWLIWSVMRLFFTAWLADALGAVLLLWAGWLVCRAIWKYYRS